MPELEPRRSPMSLLGLRIIEHRAQLIDRTPIILRRAGHLRPREPEQRMRVLRRLHPIQHPLRQFHVPRVHVLRHKRERRRPARRIPRDHLIERLDRALRVPQRRLRLRQQHVRVRVVRALPRRNPKRLDRLRHIPRRELHLTHPGQQSLVPLVHRQRFPIQQQRRTEVLALQRIMRLLDRTFEFGRSAHALLYRLPNHINRLTPCSSHKPRPHTARAPRATDRYAARSSSTAPSSTC